MKSFNTGSAQYNNFGEFGDYLKNLWGGQGQAQPWLNPDSGIPQGGFAGATGVPAAPLPAAPQQAAPWMNPDAPKDDAKRKMMMQLLAKPEPAPVDNAPQTLQQNETQMFMPEAPEQLNPKEKRFVGRGRGATPSKPQGYGQNMRGYTEMM